MTGLGPDRFIMVGETPYAHEREGLELIRSSLPDRDPYHARCLVDLVDRDAGRLYEIDAIVLGYAAIFLVELKHYEGRIEGDEHGWTWTPPGSRPLLRDNPFSATYRKAQALASRLAKHYGGPGPLPWVQPLIVLSNAEVENRLSPEGKMAVVTREGIADAIMRSRFPNPPRQAQGPRIDEPTMRHVLRAFDRAGLQPRKGKLRVGSFVLGSILEDGPNYQDREATHESLPNVVQRARIYLEPQQTSKDNRARLRAAAEREYRLLHSVREHATVLSPQHYSIEPLGPTLLFEGFEGGMRLDRFLARHPDLVFAKRIEILRQLAHGLSYCHKRSVVHGGLSPEAVLVRERPGETGETKVEARLFNFHLGSGESISPTKHRSLLATAPLEAYQAPELVADPTATSSASDVFSLGALAYWLFTGQAPADDRASLLTRLAREHCLDPSAAADDLPEPVIDAVQQATQLDVVSRIDDPTTWIECLVADLRPAEAEPESTRHVLEAEQGDILVERFTVEKVLGHGASARVLHVVEDDKRHYALKVSLGEEHDERLRAEGEVLATLRHARIVQWHETLEMSGRVCLLLSLAGDATLREVLRDQGTLELDYAIRYGEDLLDALRHLEEHRIPHRDIKPANLGTGTAGKSAKHLTLFDFSLVTVPDVEVDAGTAAYRDPFLHLRGRWDHHADRWSAAVTLHEMLTGERPSYGAPGQSPLVPEAKLRLSAERFDAGVRDRLVAFFTRALAREVEQRFASADEMRRAWLACVDGPIAPGPGDSITAGKRPHVDLEALTDAQVREIRPDTPIGALPLSMRARNALDRAGLTRAEELLRLPPNRLSAIRGIGRKVTQEILGVRDRWRSLGAGEAEPAEAFMPGYAGPDLRVDAAGLSAELAEALERGGLPSLGAVARAPRSQVEAIAEREGTGAEALRGTLERLQAAELEAAAPTTLEGWLRASFPAGEAKDRRAMEWLRQLFGLEAPFVGRLGVVGSEVAEHAKKTRARIQQVHAQQRAWWSGQAWKPTLVRVVIEAVESLGGVATVQQAASTLAVRMGHEGAIEDDPLTLAGFAALVRVAAEVDPEAEEPSLAYRRRERSDRAERWEPWVFVEAAGERGHERLWTLAERLGDAADELAARPVLASPGEARRVLAEIVEGTPLAEARVGATRLLDLAAAASKQAARSSRLELYPKGLPAKRALELSAQVITPRLTPEQVLRRVASRYPAAESLPQRPALDGLLWDLLKLRWNEAEGCYAGESTGEPTSVLSDSSRPVSRHPTAMPGQVRSRSDAALRGKDFEDDLQVVVERRGLRVLGVSPAHAPQAIEELERVLGVEAVVLDRELIAEMEAVAVERKIKGPEVLWAADAAGPQGKAWPRLLMVARQAAERLMARLLPPREPLLLVQCGLVARYELGELLERILGASQEDEAAAIVMVIPGREDDAGVPRINDRLAVPGLLRGQSGWIPREWIRNDHRRPATEHPV